MIIDRSIDEGREIRLLNRRLPALMIAIIRKTEKQQMGCTYLAPRILLLYR